MYVKKLQQITGLRVDSGSFQKMFPEFYVHSMALFEWIVIDRIQF